MGIYACGLLYQIRVAYAKVDRMKQEIKFITFYKFYITDTIQFETNYVTLKDTTETVTVELDDSTSLYTSQEISKRNGLLTSISW